MKKNRKLGEFKPSAIESEIHPSHKLKLILCVFRPPGGPRRGGFCLPKYSAEVNSGDDF